jgi:aerobic-type carbon monoxide dehydrogenase small subunit (CoxS/CutS family)
VAPWIAPEGSSVKRLVQFKLNGAPVSLEADDERMLLWVLRTDLALTGTKYGCGEGICGACAVVIDGQAERSCRMPLKAVAGADVVTVEGLAHGGKLHPLQQAFIGHGAFQCGYCTSGMLLDAYALLEDDPHPTRDKIVARMDHNLCRCGAHQRIVAAIEAVAGQTAADR